MKTLNSKISILALIALIFSVNPSFAQIKGNGNVVSEDRNIDSFTGIEISSSVDVFISKGNTNTITVKADENLLPVITTEVANGILKIDNKKSIYRAKTMEVYVSMDNMEKIISSGSGDVTCKGGVEGREVLIQLNGSGDFDAELSVKNMELKINGSGDAEFSGVRGDLKIHIGGSGDVEAEDLQLQLCEIKVNGSGNVELKGAAEQLTVRQSGSGDLNAYNLKAVHVSVRNSGSGDMVVHAIENLDVNLNGSGDVTYAGSPKVNIEAHGSGEVYSK